MNKNVLRLQVPGQWAVCYNSFGDEEMIVVDGSIENAQYYKEDLLWLQSLRSTPVAGSELDPSGWLVDVGWYPAEDPTGTYILHVFRLDPTENSRPLNPPQFHSRNRYQVRAVIEYMLHQIGRGSWNDDQERTRQQLAALQRLHDQEKLVEFLDGIK